MGCQAASCPARGLDSLRTKFMRPFSLEVEDLQLDDSLAAHPRVSSDGAHCKACDAPFDATHSILAGDLGRSTRLDAAS
jgi:hypothetical protein